jgi:hypothetical protein
VREVAAHGLDRLAPHEEDRGRGVCDEAGHGQSEDHEIAHPAHAGREEDSDAEETHDARDERLPEHALPALAAPGEIRHEENEKGDEARDWPVRDVVEARRDLRGLAQDPREDRGGRAEQDDEARGAEERHREDEEDRSRKERLFLLLAGRAVQVGDDRDLSPAPREEAEAADEEDEDDPDEPGRDSEVDERVD